MTLEGLNREQT